MRAAGSHPSSRNATLHVESAYCRRRNAFIDYVMKRHSAEPAIWSGCVESLAVTKRNCLTTNKRMWLIRWPLKCTAWEAQKPLKHLQTRMLAVPAAQAVRVGAHDLTVPMPVLACTGGASIENNNVCICLYWYWSVLVLVLVCTWLHWDCIGECTGVCIGTYKNKR